jgi:hypothetical protein
MDRWSEVAARVAATTRTSEKVAAVAGYLGTLDDEALPPAVTFFTGRPFAERDQRTPGIGWAAIVGVAEAIVGGPAGAFWAA